jgi:hypothetical protein
MTMPSIDLRLAGEGAFADWQDKTIEKFTTFRMSGFKDGMASGNPSVCFAVELEDGRVVYLETSLMLLEAGISGLKARWEAFG